MQRNLYGFVLAAKAKKPGVTMRTMRWRTFAARPEPTGWAPKQLFIANATIDSAVFTAKAMLLAPSLERAARTHRQAERWRQRRWRGQRPAARSRVGSGGFSAGEDVGFRQTAVRDMTRALFDQVTRRRSRVLTNMARRAET